MMTVVFVDVVAAAVAVIVSAAAAATLDNGVVVVVVAVVDHSPAISLFSFSGIVRVHDRGAASNT